jgi:hypothetical protein
MTNCTKSLRDSLGLTALVMSEGMLWCAALDRVRETVRLPHVSILGNLTSRDT